MASASASYPKDMESSVYGAGYPKDMESSVYGAGYPKDMESSVYGAGCPKDMESSMYVTACATLDVMCETAYQPFGPVDELEGIHPLEVGFCCGVDATGRTPAQRDACYAAWLAKNTS